MHTQTRLRHQTFLAPLYRVLPWPHCLWELHAIGLCLPRGGRGGGLPLCAHTDVILCLVGWCKKTYFQVFCTVWTPNSHFLKGLVCLACPHRHVIIGLLWMSTNCAEGTKNIPNRLPNIFQDPRPIKETCKGVKVPMNPLRVVQVYQAVFRGEEFGSDLHLSTPSLWALLSLHHNQYPLIKHLFHHNIKNI